jgi:D-3-phosphoglycerate dehydrogenase
MGKGKVLIAAPVHPVLTEGLTALGYEILHQKNITREGAAVLLNDCTGVIISTRLQMDREMLDNTHYLKWIGRMGSGMEVIDVPYAEEKGIRCFSSPEGNCNSVAEHALGMLLALTKKIVVSHEEVKNGLWHREKNRGIELEGKTIGIIGFGHTGKAFAKKLSGFDIRILAYDKYEPVMSNGNVVGCTELTPLFKEADIISFHVPIQDGTYHYFNKDFINHMSKPFILINTSRGTVVDTGDLVRGLKEGKITGAALDVLEEEPLERMGVEIKKLLNELIRLPQVVITPHIAGYSYESVYKMSKALLDKIVTVG